MSCIKKIPSVFFQTSREPLPTQYTDMIKHCLTPEWSYEHYTDEGVFRFFEENPDTEFPQISDKFKEIVRGEHKADLFRYYYLYKKGGVFIDSDAMIYEPIEGIVCDYKFFSVESTNVPNTMFQGVIGAEPQNPLIYGALKSMYSMDLTQLQGSYQIICADIFSLYKATFQDNPDYVLFKEVPHKVADKIVDSSGTILFKHYWRNKDGIPNYLPNLKLYKRMESGISKRKPFLVYFCVFYNQDYFRLLELLLKSITIFSKTDQIDLLVFTNREFEPAVHKLAVELNLFLYVKSFHFTTIFQAACARLYIFDYEYINSYEKIFYLDTDIIIKKDITPVFDLDLAEVLYGLECGTISSPSFGCYLFDLNTIDPNTSGINSGSLLFKNCQTIRDLFSRMQKNINEHTKAGLPIPYCMDQPFINYHAIIGNLYDNKYLNPHISLYEGNDEVNNYETSSVCHFSYPIGNFQHKYDRMVVFLNKILAESGPAHDNSNEWVQNIVDCIYSWASGFIEFKADSLITTWGTGNYTVKGKNRIEVFWNNHHHVLQLSHDYTKYSCLRTYPADLIFVSGCLMNGVGRLYIYGDSHTYASFMNLKIPHINFYDLNGITMHRIGRDKEILKFNKIHCSPKSVFCICYGEIDVRCHIGKQVDLGREESEICLELVKAYFETIRATITEYKAIIVVGIVPPVRVEDHVHADHIPFIGTNEERVRYTATMNKHIEEMCSEYGYHYFNPYAPYVDTDGCMNNALSDKCVHVGPNEGVLKKFGELYEIVTQPKPKNTYIYIHVCCINNWKEIFNNLLFCIKDSGLYNIVCKIRCCILTQNKDDLGVFSDEKIEIIGVYEDIGLFETPTINAIHAASLTDDFNVLYIHTKGVNHFNTQKGVYVLDWVKCLTYFNIYKHSICMDKLKEYDAVSINLTKYPVLHFSGNFWWSKSEHIRTLPMLVYREYNSPEYWITEKKDGSYLSLWNTNIIHYFEPYDESNYIDK